jgi:uncharacterized membrane protein YfcA
MRDGHTWLMTVGTSLFLIALGAILRFAIQDSIQDVDLSIVGVILMIVGAVGLVVGLWQTRRFTGGSEPVARDRYDRPV